MEDVQMTEAVPPPRPYSITHQKVELDIDFTKVIRGRTEITIYPESADVRIIGLHARQCIITSVQVNGLTPQAVRHSDPCSQMRLHADATVHQHHMLQEKIAGAMVPEPSPDLFITLPERLRIEKVNLAEVHTQTGATITLRDQDTLGVDAAPSTQGLTDTSVAKFTPLLVKLDFVSGHATEALQVIPYRAGSGRWPHLYTHNKRGSAITSSIFPCLDLLTWRCTWEISITCPKTIGAISEQKLKSSKPDDANTTDVVQSAYAAKEVVVICTGEQIDDTTDKNDPTWKTVSFSCSQQLSPRQVGFAVGPFECVKLSKLREAQEAATLGSTAVDVLGYCLPGRAEEVENTCLATVRAFDFFVRKYIACPLQTYSMCFVEDAPQETSTFSGLTMCSTQMLFPEEVIDPAQDVTRTLTRTIASQWIGIDIVPEQPSDSWVVVGSANYMADLFMKDLCGNNEYRCRMRQQSDLVCDLDHDRPSIFEIGRLLHLDSSEFEFLSIKSPMVLFILDRRIAKVTGISKMPAVIAKILTRARIGELNENLLSMDVFQKTCERFYHAKIDDFIQQWVKGAGCPRFHALQKFNKKKLVVEMGIRQVQGNVTTSRELEPQNFMRDVREEYSEVYAAPIQPIFTGPMTIRIHEADGTPYEHIVEIKDGYTSFDIPYNTKYKRLKRSKKQKTKQARAAANEGGEDENDSLVYCLGDVLQGEEDIANWKLTEWTPEDEERMSSESYEWIRLDADFEWLCKTQLQMPGYMFSSQLQQDRDVVAQIDSINSINLFQPSPLISTILIRTLMDRRYFHGVRSLAAKRLIRQASDEGNLNSIGLFHLKKAFEELYCTTEHGSTLTRPNDFSDNLSYILQGEIVEALSQVRDKRGHAPLEVKEFLLDKLKYNDNSINPYSDAHYVSRLMRAVCSAVIARPIPPAETDDDDDDNMDMELVDEMYMLRQLEADALSEIDRYRRMDEWTSSYQNLYSRTALECQDLLAKAGIGKKFSPLHFLQYTRPGNYEMLRLASYEILFGAKDVFENKSVLRYLVHCMVADRSPWIRRNLQAFFGRALGRRAIGDSTATTSSILATGSSAGAGAGQSTTESGLVIEDANVVEAKLQDLDRRRNIEAAMNAVKIELGGPGNQDDPDFEYGELKNYLWDAVCYPEIGMDDLRILLEFCRLLYVPKDEFKVVLQLPFYWFVKYMGKGKLKFTQTGKVRSKPAPKWQPSKTAVPTFGVPSSTIASSGHGRLDSKQSGSGLKISFKKKDSMSRPGPSPTPPPPQPSRSNSISNARSHTQAAEPPASAAPGRLVLKFGVGKPKN